MALLVLAALGWLKWGLDPWLRGKLERAVTTQTHGQYALHVAGLRTKLLARSLHLRGILLRPSTEQLADTLPHLTVHLARLDLSGVGLLALLRGRTVPIDSLSLDSLHLDVAALARRPAPHPTPPFYQQHPLRLGYLALRHAGGSFGPAETPTGQLREATVSARDLLLTSAGAADTQRLAFAAGWRAVLRQPAGKLGGHTISARLVDFSSDKQFFGLDSLRIAPPAPGQGKPGAARVSFAVPSLWVRGLRAAAWQHLHRLRADSVRLTTPRLTFEPPAQAPPPVWKLLKPLFDQADVRQLAIGDGYLAVGGVAEKPAVRHLFGVARGLRIDSAAAQPGAKRVLYARGWTGRTGRITATFQPPVYLASIEHALLNTDEKTLRLTGLALRPTLSAAQLNRRSGYQTTLLRVLMPELRAEGFDFYRLSDDSHLQIARVVAERPYLATHSDGRGPINKSPSIITPENMRSLRAHLDVRQLDVRGGTIAAVYRGPRTPLPGTFTLNRLNITLRNVSNDPRRMSLAHPLTGEATGYLQNQSRAEIHLTTSLLDPQGRQHLWGTFGPAPLSLLNSITTPTRLITFKSGQVQRITFDERLDRQRVSGPIQATYTDLKINYLGYKDGQVKKTFLNRVKSGLVNGLVIRDQNPRPGGRFVVGQMASRRELQFSTFTAWRQGLLCGLLQSVGVPDKLAQQFSQSSDPTPLPPPDAR
ncbi:hypothetical protein A0257_04650 [Hymenobacter psoromatis]|nr:hypothetical protein A0257_04650 [Hymenobacter psoromatis]